MVPSDASALKTPFPISLNAMILGSPELGTSAIQTASPGPFVFGAMNAILRPSGDHSIPPFGFQPAGNPVTSESVAPVVVLATKIVGKKGEPNGARAKATLSPSGEKEGNASVWLGGGLVSW
jgi:hypothetical protein